MMKLKVVLAGLALAMVASMGSACTYGAVTEVGEDRVVVAQNNGFLFGLLNAVYVCDVTDAGLANCSSSESP